MKRNNQLYGYIKKLKQKKVIIGVLSDQWHLSRESMFPEKDKRLFDVVIISYEVKTRKPHPDIYKLLLKKIHLKNPFIKPSQIIFIDDKNYNLEPAKKLGMKTILFKNNVQVMQEMGRLF